MKTAVLLSGLIRCFGKCYPSLLESIIKPLNADVFISSWDFSDPEQPNDVTIKETISLCDPKIYLFEKWDQEKKLQFDRKKYEVRKYKHCHKIMNTMAMFYKMKSANDLKMIYEQKNDFKYDVVIRARTDMVFGDSFKQEEVIELVSKTHGEEFDNIIAIPDGHGWPDTFALGSSENMDYYNSVYGNIDRYWEEEDCLFGGEFLLRHHLVKCKKIVSFDFSMKLRP